MKRSRRDILGTFVRAAALAAAGPASLAAGAAVPTPTPWRNWSGALAAMPRARVAPADEAELARFLRTTTAPFRPVGSGHSFSPLVPTDGDLVAIDRLAGLAEIDEAGRRARVRAGTRLADLGPLLERAGQASVNLPDIDRQTLAGALATATHGTGDFPSLSGQVEALRIVTSRGELRSIDASEPDLLAAAATNLGALGVVTEATLANVAPYRLRARNFTARLDVLLAEFDARVRAHRHFEFFPLPHCDWALALEIDEAPADAPTHNPPPTPEEDAALREALELLLATPLRLRRPLANEIAQAIDETEAADASYGILCNIRNTRFNEMEYSVPADVGMACVREVMDTIAEGIDVTFPLEVRYVGAETPWLSMFEGGPRVSISIHDFAERDHRPYFDRIEPVFAKYGGRPHWGKVHSLTAGELRELYPRFDDFRRIRAEFDPEGRMLNPHLHAMLDA
ncbi:MAG: D-arabinono-1,4-lactone oxidase [Pseudomonadales bacterium]|jgi:FAD-linked oxidoreductase|nr:D-arabinono-1,4-lactone oxidase [Pseudomonadales bacterium]